MREALWTLGVPIRWPLLGVVRVWRRLIGPMTGPRCRFHPSCSAYAEEAIRTHGALKGVGLAVWRILRCSPLSTGGIDEVPPRGGWSRAKYDVVTQSVTRSATGSVTQRGGA